MERTRVIENSKAIEAIKTCEDLGLIISRNKSGVTANIPEWKTYISFLPSHGEKEKIKKFEVLLVNIGLAIGTKKHKKISGQFTISETGTIRFNQIKPRKKKRTISEDALDHRLPGHFEANK